LLGIFLISFLLYANRQANKKRMPAALREFDMEEDDDEDIN